jgi:hypothetical protein
MRSGGGRKCQLYAQLIPPTTTAPPPHARTKSGGGTLIAVIADVNTWICEVRGSITERGCYV